MRLQAEILAVSLRFRPLQGICSILDSPRVPEKIETHCVGAQAAMRNHFIAILWFDLYKR